MPPRFFLPTGDARPLPGLPAETLCDLLRFGPAGAEWAVVRDGLGLLRAVPVPELPPALSRQVHARELAAGLPRRLAVRELWLLEAHALEEGANLPGVNDPVELVGRLTGPFGTSEVPEVFPGRLSVTRADVLAGFADGEGFALPVTGEGGGRGSFVPAMLPGDRVERIQQGLGAVLTLPLHPVELGGDPGNDLLVTEHLFGLLSRLQAELRAVGGAHPLLRAELPVLDREAAIAELRAAGYTIDGDTALPNLGLSDRLLQSITVLIGPNPEIEKLRRPVPKQGTLSGYLTLVREALATLPGWPDARASALRALTEPSGPPRVVQVPRDAGLVPAAAPPPARRAPASPPPPSAAKQAPPRSKRPPPAPPERLPSVSPPVPGRSRRREWADDFGPRPPAPEPPVPEPAAPRRPAATPPKKPGRPTWMDDFES